MRPLLSVVLLAAGCTAAPPPRVATATGPGAYTPTPAVGLPVGALSTSCRFDTNGLGAACSPIDREVEGPVPPISAGQPR